MYRPEKTQVRQQVEGPPETACSSDSLNYWRTQATKASEREREALKLAAEYQHKTDALRDELSRLKDNLYKLLK